MTSISAASTNTYQSPLQKLQDELLSEVNSGADQFVGQGRAVVGADRYRFGDAGEPRQRPGRRHAAVARRPEIEDRRPDRRRSFQRQADQRSGHRTAGRLQGGLRQRSRRLGWPGRPAGGPPPGGHGGPPPSDDASSSDDTSSSSTSIDDILKQFLQSLQESLSASSSTSYSATGTTSSSSSSASFSALLIDYQS